MFSEKLLLFTPLDTKVGEGLHQEVSATLPGVKISYVHSPVRLSRCLRQPGHGVGVAVILVEDRHCLQELLLAKLLEDLKVILVVPAGDMETLTQGHFLRHRFTTPGRGHFKEVRQVLHNLLMATEACGPWATV